MANKKTIKTGSGERLLPESAYVTYPPTQEELNWRAWSETLSLEALVEKVAQAQERRVRAMRAAGPVWLALRAAIKETDADTERLCRLDEEADLLGQEVTDADADCHHAFHALRHAAEERFGLLPAEVEEYHTEGFKRAKERAAA